VSVILSTVDIDRDQSTGRLKSHWPIDDTCEILNAVERRGPSHDAGRRTKFAPVKSLDSSEFSSEFSDLKTLTSNVKVNPVISW